MKFRILHVTDFHFVSKDDPKYKNVSERIVFHENLRKFLVNEFKGKIDYLLLTGDFGDRCKSWNLTYAKDWLTNLHDDLGIPLKNIIFCPGNHDIETDDIPVEHHTARTDHTKGQKYLFSIDYKDKIFSTYKADIDNTWNPEDLVTVYREFDDVRFIVLNSSWLSQANGKAIADFERAIIKDIGEGKTSTYEKLAIEFGGVFYDQDPIIFDKEKEKKLAFLPGMLNLSENKTQQLGFYKNKKIIEAIEKLDSTKINILVFHHPETHLHPFERNYIKDIGGSGFYKYLSSKCHLLICGHTHPVESEDINNNYYNHLPNFVGGGAHLNDYGTNDRPFFYCYEVNDNKDTEDILEIRRDIYLYTESQFYLAGKGKERGTIDTTEINLNSPNFESRDNFCQYENPPGQIESYNILKEKMRCYVNDSLLQTLKSLDQTFQLHETSKFVKMPKEMKRPDTDTTREYEAAENSDPTKPKLPDMRNMYVKEAKLNSDIVNICFDVIFTDELDFGPERECVAIRIQKGLGEATANSIYYPLFIDPLSCLLEDAYRSDYEELLALKIDYFLTKNKISLPMFDQQLPDFYPILDDVESGIEFVQELRVIQAEELDTIRSVNYSGRYSFSQS